MIIYKDLLSGECCVCVKEKSVTPLVAVAAHRSPPITCRLRFCSGSRVRPPHRTRPARALHSLHRPASRGGCVRGESAPHLRQHRAACGPRVGVPLSRSRRSSPRLPSSHPTGDEMFADSYPMREVEDGFFFEVDGKVRRREGEQERKRKNARQSGRRCARALAPAEPKKNPH